MTYGTVTKLYDTACLKTAGVVGTGIHLYSLILNNQHFQGIVDDFSNHKYLQGTLKVAFPLILPYAVSLYSRRKAQKEVQGKISKLEEKIKVLEP